MTTDVAYPSPLVDAAVAAAREGGVALCKFIQANEVGITGGHQTGFHIPLSAWQYFTPFPPTRGQNHTHPARIEWDSGDVTDSNVKWYGVGTRHEYRLTSFNRIRHFYALDHRQLGSLLVLVPMTGRPWYAFVLEHDEDIEAVQAALGLDLTSARWALYTGEEVEGTATVPIEECTAKSIAEKVRFASAMPSMEQMSAAAREISRGCYGEGSSPDERLLRYMDLEFALFRAYESALYLDQVRGGFDTLDDFLALAQRLTQSRRARAGGSLERQVQAILDEFDIAYEAQPALDGTVPDFVFPSAQVYRSAPGQSIVLAVKRTCKDRWRQVLNEAPSVSTRYLLTLQPGISTNQLREMRQSGVVLVVPESNRGSFAPSDRDTLLSFSGFLELAQAANPRT